MLRYRRLLPSTSRLVAFAAVAKAQSVTAAAEMLGLTQAAVSRQLRELEDFIGQPLAKRSSKGVTLTQAGQRLITDLPSALDQICDAVEASAETGGKPSVTVFCDHSLTTSWLNRKVLEFEGLHPDVDVQVLSSNRRPDAFAGQFDLAVLHGRPETSAYQSRLICPDHVFPVAAPSVVASIPRDKGIEALLDYPLLDLAETRRDWLGWSDFLLALGVEHPPRPKATFDSYVIAIEAARLGQGILLGWEFVLNRHLEEGSLQPIGTWSMDSPGGLRVHFPMNRVSETASKFLDWLCPPN